MSAAFVGKLKEPTLSDEHASSEGSSSTSVADLLARLQNPRPTPVQQTPPEILQQIAPTPNVEDAERFLSDSFPSRVEKRNSNTRHLSFQQSLPVLAQLSENTECIHVISKVSLGTTISVFSVAKLPWRCEGNKMNLKDNCLKSVRI